MKLVKEILFEKFAEDTDPVHDLGIGGFKAVVQHIFDIDRKNNFIQNSNYNGNINYISMSHAPGRGQEHVPGIHFEIHFYSNIFYDTNKLNRDGKPKRIVKLKYAKKLLDEAGVLDYFSNIEYGNMTSFIVDCRVKEKYKNFFIPGIYFDKKKLIENINEKFKEESDPIKDLGIGLHKFWYEKYKEIGNSQPSYTYEKYFNAVYNYNSDNTKCVYVLWDTLLFLIDGINPQTAFNKASLGKTFLVRKKVANALKKHFYVNIKVGRKDINEKFIEDSDPIKDLGIGYKNYEKFANTYFVENTLNALEKKIVLIIMDAFNVADLFNIYYLCSMPFSETLEEHTYHVKEKIKNLIKPKNIIYEKNNIILNNGGSFAFKLYQTPFGKIGELIFGLNQRNKPTYRYIGDIVAIVELYEIRERYNKIYK